MRFFLFSLVFVWIACAGGGPAAHAQDAATAPAVAAGGTTHDADVPPDSLDALRSRLRLPTPTTTRTIRLPAAPAFPSTTINTPTGFGARWGQVYSGASYQDRIRYSDWTDGILSMGAGFGNPRRRVGVDVTLNLLDTYTEFAKDRSVSVKVHRRLPYATSVAVGWENIWHTETTDGGSSRYAVASKVARLHSGSEWLPLGVVVATVGVGNDRFQREDRFRQREEGIGVFGSLAVRITRPVNAIANWTGQDLSLGLSIAPIRSIPFIITPALMDVTGRAGDGTRFSASATIIYDFRR